MYSQEELKEQLAAMGIRSDDTVVVHTSFKAVGNVENGPTGYLDALCDYLRDGLLVIPTHTWGVVNAEHPYYRVSDTMPNIGVVPCTAAVRPDGLRSLHPTHSVWAHGRDAAALIAGEETAETPAPVGGTWWKLGQRHAKILLVGVLLNRNTYIHAVDEIAGLDDRLSDAPYTVTIEDHEGRTYTHPMRGHCRHNGSHHFDNYDQAFTSLGVQTFGQLGDAVVRVVDALKCRDTVLRIYSRTDVNPCRYAQYIPTEWWQE